MYYISCYTKCWYAVLRSPFIMLSSHPHCFAIATFLILEHTFNKHRTETIPTKAALQSWYDQKPISLTTPQRLLQPNTAIERTNAFSYFIRFRVVKGANSVAVQCKPWNNVEIRTRLRKVWAVIVEGVWVRCKSEMHLNLLCSEWNHLYERSHSSRTKQISKEIKEKSLQKPCDMWISTGITCL